MARKIKMTAEMESLITVFAVGFLLLLIPFIIRLFFRNDYIF